MLEESQRTLISMAELVSLLNKEIKELKYEKENLKTQITVKNNMLQFKQQEIERLSLKNIESQKTEDYSKLKDEIKQKDNMLKLYEEQLKKYRKKEKEKEEACKILEEVMKEGKNK